MPIHILGALAETTSISTTLVVSTTCLVGLLLVLKTLWIEGRKCTWERDWAGKFLIVIAPPSPLVYALLDHLVNLPHPPEVLYLPPLASPLPQELLTILHAIQLSAARKTGLLPPPPTTSTTDAASLSSNDTPSSIPTTSLHCEPLPRDPASIKDFIRKWAIKPPGTADSGRRIDGIVWADEWDVSRPWRLFTPRAATVGEQDGGDTWAGVQSPKPEAGVKWTAEQAKFHFITSILPFLLQAPMERSIRLINVLSPFYSAAVPLLKSSPAEQGEATDKVLTSTEGSSPVVQSGKAALRNILLWSHLQRIVDALASVTHNQAQKTTAVPVPEETPQDGGVGDVAAEGLRRRKGESVEEKVQSQPQPTKRITVQSNILALPVIIGFNRWGIVRPLLGLRERSYLGWALYISLSPLIYLVTPSTNSALQSILYALSAPVLYDDDDATNDSQQTGKVDAGSKSRRDGVKGGGIIRDASWIPNPFAPSWADPLAPKIWDQLEVQVEQGVKAEAEAESGQGKTGEVGGKKVSFA